MFTSKYFKSIALAAVLFAFTTYTASAAGNFTTIDYPGAWGTQVWGTNSAGDIVGGFGDAAGWHGFLLRKGIYTPIDHPGALWTDAYGINPRGDIVGQYGFSYTEGNNTVKITRGFLLRAGRFHQAAPFDPDQFEPLDIAGHQNTMPFKISPNGTVVGCLHENLVDAMYGFRLTAKGAVNETLIRSMNLGINPDGDVVGYYFGTPEGTPLSRAAWSYLIRDGVMNWFQYPGAFATLATDISPGGTIVGRYRMSPSLPVHGFILNNGEFESFDVPGAALTAPFGVNAKGDIVGYYTVGTGNAAVYHGFLRQE